MLYKLTKIMFWLGITSVPPFMFFILKYHPYKFLTIASTGFLTAYILLTIKPKTIKLNIYLLIVLIAQLFGIMLLGYVHTDTEYFSLIFRYVTAYIFLYYIIAYYSVGKFIRDYIYVMIGIGILGMVGFFFALSGLYEANVNISPDGHKIYNYLFTFSSSVHAREFGDFIRVSGFFDEPGSYAFLLLNAIFLNRVFFNNTKYETLLTIVGLFSISLSFYITMLFYIMLTRIRSIKIVIAFLVLILLLIALFPIAYKYQYANKTTESLYAFTYKRIEFADNNKKFIKGDNRTDLLIESLKYIKKRPFFGYGITGMKQDISTKKALGGSIGGRLVNHGIIGFIFVYLHVIILITYFMWNAMKERTVLISETFIVTFLLLNYIQRPQVDQLLSYILVIMMIIGFAKHRQGIQSEYIYGQLNHV